MACVQGARAVYTVRPDGSELTAVCELVDDTRVAIARSPDGRALPLQDAVAATVDIVRADGGERQRIAGAE